MGLTVHVFQFDEVHLPIAPFISVNIIVVVYDKTFPVRLPLLPEEKFYLAYAIDDAVFGCFKPCYIRKGRQEVNDVDDLVALSACGNFSRPPYQERCA